MHSLRRMGLVGLWLVGVLALLAVGTGTPAQTADGEGGPPDAPAKKVPLDKTKVPPGTLVVVVTEKDLGGLPALFPQAAIFRWDEYEKYEKLKERVALLEKQLKGE